LGRHDESRIKRVVADERRSTGIRVISEYVAATGSRPANEWIRENSAVNPRDLIECFFDVIPQRLGKVHGVINRRWDRIEAFLV
jgi:hypothetical protein